LLRIFNDLKIRTVEDQPGGLCGLPGHVVIGCGAESGEGNRTLFISLEGFEPALILLGYSDLGRLLVDMVRDAVWWYV
jgi:hypothetical protein